MIFRYFDQVVWPSYRRHLFNALALARDCIMHIRFIDSTLFDFSNRSTIKEVFFNFF